MGGQPIGEQTRVEGSRGCVAHSVQRKGRKRPSFSGSRTKGKPFHCTVACNETAKNWKKGVWQTLGQRSCPLFVRDKELVSVLCGRSGVVSNWVAFVAFVSCVAPEWGVWNGMRSNANQDPGRVNEP